MEDQIIRAMNATEYKTYHESMMLNNEGSSALPVFCCIFFTVQCTIYSSIKIKNLPRQYIQEYLVIVLPMILAHTVLSNSLIMLNTGISFLLFHELQTYYRLRYIRKIPKVKPNQLKRKQSVTVLRGLTYLITIFCILAVDFNSFPRRLAKTERYGHSLMDTGVGLFVLMSGLVHRDLKKKNWRNVFLGNVKFILVLATLGVVRYLSIKHLDYQEHMSEYGVHWNFFFTLAICKFFSTFLLYFSSSNTCLLSFIILMIHELILYCGVQNWVFGNTPRDNFLSANKEGVSSCLGYVAMYLFASHLKADVLMNRSVASNLYYKGKKVDSSLLKLVVGSIVLWILTYLSDYFRPASRTLANWSYCIFVESVLTTITAVLYFFEKYFYNKEGNFELPLIIDYINSNGLLYFLIANLLTGAINLSCRTFLVSSAATFLILNAYMIATLTLPYFLHKLGAELKCSLDICHKGCRNKTLILGRQ